MEKLTFALGPSTDQISITKRSIKALHTVLRLTDTSDVNPDLQDVVLIAVDTENTNKIIKNNSLENINSQIGFAVFDTRDLLTLKNINIPTYNFATGTSQYHARVSYQYIFGNSVKLCKKILIRAIIPKSRRIIFVGHDVKQDLRALFSLDPEFWKSISDNIVGVFDTQRIAHDIQQNSLLADGIYEEAGYSLYGLLKHFDCPFRNLHCAGNDAHFTLRLLLVLAIHSVQDMGQLIEHVAAVIELQRIAYAALPAPKPIPSDIDITGIQKLRRAERNYQSRHRNSKVVKTVRAERAKKRAEAFRSLIAESDDLLSRIVEFRGFYMCDKPHRDDTKDEEDKGS
ncbi:hypothetical protein TWF281_011450 [Arthrobotrys megalospora]